MERGEVRLKDGGKRVAARVKELRHEIADLLKHYTDGSEVHACLMLLGSGTGIAYHVCLSLRKIRVIQNASAGVRKTNNIGHVHVKSLTPVTCPV